jgi:hypothetical protein
MTDIVSDFGDIVHLESLGKTYENRDIWMLKVDATPKHLDKKAILLTGAHHSRELVSIQMPLFTILDLLHGWVHGHPEKTMLLQ